MNKPILTEQKGSILQITLSRPEAYNALNLPMMQMLAESLAASAQDDSIQGVVITGAGKAFCAGGDLKWISQQSDDFGSTLHKLAPQFHIGIAEIRRMRKPVVAAINGVAAGGGFSLALACDFRVMAESAVLRQAYTSSGLSIDGGGTFSLELPNRKCQPSARPSPPWATMIARPISRHQIRKPIPMTNSPPRCSAAAHAGLR